MTDLKSVLNIFHFYVSRNAKTWGQIFIAFRNHYILFIWMLDVRLFPDLALQYPQTLSFRFWNLTMDSISITGSIATRVL